MTGLAVQAVDGTSQVAGSGRHLWRGVRRHPDVAAGVIVLAIALIVAVFAPLIAPFSPIATVGGTFGRPSARHLLGLDDGGIDVLSELIYGARVSMTVGIAAAAITVGIGGLIGLVSGYFGGWVETLLMRITDYFLIVPALPLMIALAAVWGPSLLHIILVIGLLNWTATARVVRAEVLSLKQRVYTRRARALGAGPGRILARHILPQVSPLLVAYTTVSIADAIFAEVGLAFLGLGDPNAVSWGNMIENAFLRGAVANGAWWAIVPPGVCVAIIVVACSLIGRGIEDSMNPRLRVANLAVRTFRVRPLVGRGRDAL